MLKYKQVKYTKFILTLKSLIHKQINTYLLFKNNRMLLTNEYYQNVKDYLHPNIHTFVNHYRDRNIICFPNYHGCNHKNKNGKKINMN